MLADGRLMHLERLIRVADPSYDYKVFGKALGTGDTLYCNADCVQAVVEHIRVCNKHQINAFRPWTDAQLESHPGLNVLRVNTLQYQTPNANNMKAINRVARKLANTATVIMNRWEQLESTVGEDAVCGTIFADVYESITASGQPFRFWCDTLPEVSADDQAPVSFEDVDVKLREARQRAIEAVVGAQAFVKKLVRDLVRGPHAKVLPFKKGELEHAIRDNDVISAANELVRVSVYVAFSASGRFYACRFHSVRARER
jgi:hypothetical protein